MSVATPFAGVLWRAIEMSERHFSSRGNMIEVRVLISLFVRICIVEHPLIFRAGQVGIVAVFSHVVQTDDLHLAGAIFVEIKPLAVRRMPRPRHNVLPIAPDEMRCCPVRIEAMPILPVLITSKRPRVE